MVLVRSVIWTQAFVHLPGAVRVVRFMRSYSSRRSLYPGVKSPRKPASATPIDASVGVPSFRSQEYSNPPLSPPRAQPSPPNAYGWTPSSYQAQPLSYLPEHGIFPKAVHSPLQYEPVLPPYKDHLLLLLALLGDCRDEIIYLHSQHI